MRPPIFPDGPFWNATSPVPRASDHLGIYPHFCRFDGPTPSELGPMRYGPKYPESCARRLWTWFWPPQIPSPGRKAAAVSGWLDLVIIHGIHDAHINPALPMPTSSSHPRHRRGLDALKPRLTRRGLVSLRSLLHPLERPIDVLDGDSESAYRRTLASPS